MLIFEATDIIKNLNKEYPSEALDIAIQCMNKQQDLIDLLNDWDIETEAERGDTYSARLCHDMIRQFCIYAEDE